MVSKTLPSVLFLLVLGSGVGVRSKLSQQSHKALPPGYEDELYCPKLHCMQPREKLAGFAGPRSAFHECVHTITKGVTPWGLNKGGRMKHKLVTNGYHQKLCDGVSEIQTESSLAQALPPGFDEELYCPRRFCRRPKTGQLPPGPRHIYHECVYEKTTRVTPWGTSMGEKQKKRLLKRGYHQEQCSDDSASPTYNCFTKEAWSDEKTQWCCENKKLGCPSASAFNCLTREAWSEDKTQWCCENKKLGCPTFNCFTRELWSEEKTRWCCENKQLGC